MEPTQELEDVAARLRGCEDDSDNDGSIGRSTDRQTPESTEYATMQRMQLEQRQRIEALVSNRFEGQSGK